MFEPMVKKQNSLGERNSFEEGVFMQRTPALKQASVAASPLPSFADGYAKGFEEGEKQGQEAGYAKGVAQVQETQQGKLASLTIALVQKVEAALQAAHAWEEKCMADTLQLAYDVLVQVFPQLLASPLSQEAMLTFLQDIVQKNPSQKLKVHVPLPESTWLQGVLNAYDKNIEIVPSASLTSGECRVEWKEGGVEYRLPRLVERLLSYIKDHKEASYRKIPQPAEELKKESDS